MNINWKVRFKNPVFWAQVAVAMFVPILTYMGIAWNDVHTWGMLFGLLWEAMKSPVIVVAVIVSVYNALIDPTTSGISDSKQALLYTSPKKD